MPIGKPKHRRTTADAIREYCKDHPEATTKEVLAGLKKQGVKVNNPSNVSKLRKEVTTPRASVTIDQLHAAARFIRIMGGVEQANAVLRELERLR